MKERRKNLRHDIRYKVVYSPLGKPNMKKSTTSFNVSLGGIGLKIDKFIKASANLRLLIFSKPKAEPIKATGRLVWQGYLSGIGEKRAGIEFKEIPWTQLKSLLGE